MRNSIIEIISGSVLFILANILAFLYKYGAFYFLFLIGMFFILKGAHSLIVEKEFLSIRTFWQVYFIFFMAGIVLDLLFVIGITKIWSYPSYSLINYFILYLIVYPFGGFVMIYSFELLEHFFGKKPRRRRIALRHSLTFTLFLMILSFFGLVATIFYIDQFKMAFVFGFIILGLWGALNFVVLKLVQNDLLEHVFSQTAKYLLLILVVAYSQGIFHEFPNVFAKEWVYANIPFMHLTFLGIPAVILFVGWLSLVLIPYSLFELVMALNRLNERTGGKSFYSHLKEALFK